MQVEEMCACDKSLFTDLGLLTMIFIVLKIRIIVLYYKLCASLLNISFYIVSNEMHKIPG
jgi:hypothetical protein